MHSIAFLATPNKPRFKQRRNTSDSKLILQRDWASQRDYVAFVNQGPDPSLGRREDSFAALVVLGKKAIAAAEALIISGPTIDQHPQSVIYYVEQALSATDAQGEPQHLPDVKTFWNGDKPVTAC